MYQTKASNRKKIERINERMAELEKIDSVKKYKYFASLPYAKKKSLEIRSLQEWKRYFMQCRETNHYKNYCTQKQAFDRGDMQTVNTCALFARELLDTGEKLTEPDIYPWHEITRDFFVSSYIECERLLDKYMDSDEKLQRKVVSMFTTS